MRTSFILSVLLGAGVIAHPHYKLNDPLAHHHHRRQDHLVSVEYLENAQGQTTEVLDIVEAMSTVYVSGASPPTAVPAAPPVKAAPEVNVKADYHVQAQANSLPNGNVQAAAEAGNQQPNQAEWPQVPAPAPAPKLAPAPKAASAPAAAPAPAPAPESAPVKENDPSSPPSSSGDSGATVGGQNVLEVANKWRSMQGLPTFTWDDALATVSANTNAANGANSMTHHMVPPSLGQVITEGSTTQTAGDLGPMDLLWLDWICELSGEVPDFPCSEAMATTNMKATETMHAQILMNPQYTKLGCNYLDATDPGAQVFPHVWQGMLTCDVAY